MPHGIDPTKLIPCNPGETCGRRLSDITMGINWGRYTCGKAAIWTDGRQSYCNRHSMKGRFVFREGDTGAILERFDTEEQLIAAKDRFLGKTPQYLTPSHRRDLIID